LGANKLHPAGTWTPVFQDYKQSIFGLSSEYRDFVQCKFGRIRYAPWFYTANTSTFVSKIQRRETQLYKRVMKGLEGKHMCIAKSVQPEFLTSVIAYYPTNIISSALKVRNSAIIVSTCSYRFLD